MASTAADILLDTLSAWGVDTIFGLPGDGINGIMEALRLRQDSIRFVQVRHEETAALAAVGYAKFTGRLGVCLATSGPGGIHLLNGLYDAKLDHVPVLAVTGLQHHDLLSTFTQQDVELDKLFADACAYNARIMGPAHVENVVELACRTALASRAPAHVTIPIDVQSMTLGRGERSKGNVAGHVSHRMALAGGLPDEAALDRAAAIINSGRKVFILAGQGALGARDELLELAERLGAPIGKALLGKAAVPDDSEFTTGGVGLLGTQPSQAAMKACDTLLIAGSTFPYIEYYPAPGDARGVQIDRDPKRIGLRYPVEAGLVGDCAQVLRALLDRVERKPDRSFLDRAQADMAKWRELLADRGGRDDVPMKPAVVLRELGRLLDEDAILICDSGTNTAWTARHAQLTGRQGFSCSGTLATMACALPYAIGASIAHPGRQVAAVIGDGGFSMLMGDLVTLRKYALPAKLVVIRNDMLGMIEWEQLGKLGNPQFGVELEPIDFVKVAEACGIRGIRIEDPKACGGQLRDALATPGPCLVEAVVDPDEPPFPPSFDLAEAANFARAMARGAKGRGRIARTIGKDIVRELI
ncbi:MAG TPA: thiamine pyrophosphate-dependent enzyme [Allosphingosinicella sp.]|jgi:pyruvate dehydrogenase (quinone)/pyruvate oxidase|nr:thiamine pyrophosphate-dependent enzyme [Allosphingosinicella sp.]